MLLECHVIIDESVTVVKKPLVSAGLNVLVLLIRLSELVTSNTKVRHFLFRFEPILGMGLDPKPRTDELGSAKIAVSPAI